VLIYEHDRDILPLLRELVKGALDRRVLGFLVDDEVVLLGVRGIGDVLYNLAVSHACDTF